MLTISSADPATAVLTNLCDPTDRITYSALSELASVPVSTLRNRAHERQSKREKTVEERKDSRREKRQSKREKAVKQQYLTPQEEKALVNHTLRMSRNG
jgi:hypothetical protein